MSNWIPFYSERPPALACVVYYVDKGQYVWATGANYEFILKDYPKVSHWKIASEAPK